MTSTLVDPEQRPRSKEEATAYKKMSNRPRTLKENFQQQTLPGWQPIISAGRIAPALFIIGLLFVPIGVGVWIFSNNIQEKSILYTDCTNTLQPPEYPQDWNRSCSEVMSSPEMSKTKTCKCRLQFNLSTKLGGPVFIYYALENFYQNHRKYLSSRDDRQLRGDVGDADNPKEPAGACKNFDYVDEEEEETFEDGKLENSTVNNIGTKKHRRRYLPCGAIANSMFNDQIKLFLCRPMGGGGNCSDLINVPLNRTKISWPTDQEYKFKK